MCDIIVQEGMSINFVLDIWKLVIFLTYAT